MTIDENAAAWNPGEGDRILIAGTSDSLEGIRFILATLPTRSRGQIFVEVDSAEQIEPIAAPPRFAICWLLRDRGQQLQRSVDAWLSEMLPVSGTEEHNVYAWFAAEGSPRVLSSN